MFTNAAFHGDVSKVVDMAEAGMPLDIFDGYGHTALLNAVCSNQTDVVRYLLAKGANVDKQTCSGTALHAAAVNNSTEVISMLLQHEASRDIRDKYGNTPVDVARLCNQKEAVALLEQY